MIAKEKFHEIVGILVELHFSPHVGSGVGAGVGCCTDGGIGSIK